MWGGCVRHPVALATLSSMVLAWCVCVRALDPSLDVNQYAHTAWKVREGFAKSEINSIAQTPDGYLWLGTDFGLLRFDGVKALPWQPPDGEQLPSNHIYALLVARDGTLWIGTGKGLASWKDGKLTQSREGAGAPVTVFLEDHEGTLWFGVYERSKGRVCAVRAGKAECHGEGIFGDFVLALYQDRKGNLWASNGTGLWRWSPGPPERYAFPRGVIEANSLIEDDSGALVLATNDGLKRLSAGRIESFSLPGIRGQFRPLELFRSSDGGLWIGTQQGLLHLHHGRVDGFRAIDGLSGDFVDNIFEDREGNIWVATIDGLDRFRDYSIPTISRNQGLSGLVAWSVQATPDGSIWIGMADGLNRWTNGHVTVFRGRSALSENRPRDEKDLHISGAPPQIANSGLAGVPRSLGLDDGGRLWVSTSDGVFYFDRGRFTRVPGVPGGTIYSIAGDGHGKVSILHATAGVFYWSPKAAIQQTPWTQFPQKMAGAMLPDRELGGLWLGFGDGGISHLKDGKTVRSYGAADGLGDGRVTQLRFGSLGAVWAATEGGLSRIKDGHIETLSSRNGLPCNGVHWSMEDDDLDLWVYMPCGLARIERSEWHAWVDDPRHVIKTTIFDISDGVRSVGAYGGYGPNVTKSPDGRIWFLPKDGISVIDPRHLLVNKLPPPVRIEEAIADNKAYDTSLGLRLHLPSQIRHLEIDYTAFSFVAPDKVLFRFKLEGQDRDWRDVGNRRLAFYTNLAPGSYRFRVAACNNSGVWNDAGTFLDFSIAPAYYQTAWFRASCVAAFLALLWAIYQLRVQQLQRQFDIGLEARVNERTRIARELHDTLLQSFHGLMFQFQAARNMLPRRPEEAMRTLDEAISSTRGAIAESRDAISDLRSQPVTDGDLAQLLETAGEELAAIQSASQNSPAFRVIVEGEPRKVSPALQDEVYRIAREVMRNAFRHAGANQIEAEIRYDKNQLRLRVRDDGRGIDPKALEVSRRPGHWGLSGIRERAEQIGAQLKIFSEEGAGTEIELTVPVVASKDAGKNSRFKLFRKGRAS